MADGYTGIDYSLGQANFDPATHIHYGIISLGDLHEWAHEHFEAEYGPATCPKCGDEAVDYDNLSDEETDGWTHQKHLCSDYACIECKYMFDSSDAYPDEPSAWTYDGDGYTLSMDSDGDVWVLKSPYYTYAAYCSPCAPGALSLSSPCQEESGAAKGYCLGREWFQDEKAPYIYYNVSDGTLAYEPPSESDNDDNE